MAYFHKTLTKDRWYNFSRSEQLANIGSEFSRFVHLREEGEEKNARDSFDRLIELVDLSINDPKWKKSLSELLRLRDVLCDKFLGKSVYNIPTKMLKEYFLQFALIARK